ncbi:MAG: pseudomurein-binding repeat-containing protein [Thermoplasmata archaeon]
MNRGILTFGCIVVLLGLLILPSCYNMLGNLPKAGEVHFAAELRGTTVDSKGVWVLGTDVADAGAATLAGEFAQHGISDVFVLIKGVSGTYRFDRLEAMYENASKYGIKVYAWVICFDDESWGGWVDPNSTSYRDYLKNNLFLPLSQNYDFDGVILDCIRYPGTANGNTYPITSFCQEVSAIIKFYRPGSIIGAAVMPEMEVNAYNYGQNYTQMAQYLDVLLPMAYTHNYNQQPSWVSTVTQYVKQEALLGNPNCKVWTAIQSIDDNGQYMTNTELQSCINSAISGGAEGVNFFKYPITSTQYQVIDQYSVITATFEIQLYPGWNLISFPHILFQNSAVKAVFQPIWGKFDIIWTYDSLAGKWKLYDVKRPDLDHPNHFVNVSWRTGYWINITSQTPCKLPLYGQYVGAYALQLKTGWNLIAYPLLTPKTVSEVFGNLTVEIIERYDTNSSTMLSPMDKTDLLIPGCGYWVNVAKDVVLHFEEGTSNQTSLSKGEAIDACVRLANYIENYSRTPKYVTTSQGNLTMPQMLYISSKLVHDLYTGSTNTTYAVPSPDYASNPFGEVYSGSLTPVQYDDMAYRVYRFIENNGVAPNYANSPIGKIRMWEILYINARIVRWNCYNGAMPSLAYVKPVPGFKTDANSQYTGATANCQATNGSIINKAMSIICTYSNQANNGTMNPNDAMYKAGEAVYTWVRDAKSYAYYYNTQYGAYSAIFEVSAINCCDHTHAENALARSVGIPAQYRHANCQFSSGVYGHVWGYFYINGRGWIDTDAIKKDGYFGYHYPIVEYKGTYYELPFVIEGYHQNHVIPFSLFLPSCIRYL